MKILADFVGEVRISELDGDGGSELDAANFAGIADDGGEIDFEGGAAGDARLAFDAEQAAGDGGGTAANLETRAAQSAVNFGEIGFFFERKAESAEAFAERSFGVVVDAGDAAAVESRTVRDWRTSLSWPLVKSMRTDSLPRTWPRCSK